jgi:hypothetical protein
MRVRHHKTSVHKRATPEQVHTIGQDPNFGGWPSIVDGDEHSDSHDAIA